MPRLVALDMPTNDAYVAMVRRIWDEGNAVLPVDSRLPEPAKKRLLDALRPHEVRSDTGSQRRPDAIDTEVGDALVIATSGSTGDPKGVVHTYKNVSSSLGMVINCPNRLFMGESRASEIDEIRHENDPNTPFQLD